MTSIKENNEQQDMYLTVNLGDMTSQTHF